jgi:hypothetical protein
VLRVRLRKRLDLPFLFPKGVLESARVGLQPEKSKFYAPAASQSRQLTPRRESVNQTRRSAPIGAQPGGSADAMIHFNPNFLSRD